MNRGLKRAHFAFVCGMIPALIGCTSPEATRTRGGGPGADVGNRKEDVSMHSGSYPYWETPTLIPSKHPPLDSANQAARLATDGSRAK
jgi:hypothetical protein